MADSTDGLTAVVRFAEVFDFEVFGGRGVAAGENLAGVVEGYSDQRTLEDVARGGCGLFGGPVHAEFELVDLGTHACHSQILLSHAKFLRHDNFNGFIFKKSVGGAGKIYRVFRAAGERFLEFRRSLGIALIAGLFDAF